LRLPARALGVDQLWRLFSKNPSRHDGWSIVKGTLENGDVVDLLQGHGPATDARPAIISETYKNSRWRRFMMTNSVIEERGSRKKYAAWLCHSWNRAHGEGERLLKVDMVFMLETTARNFGLHPPVVPEDMGHFDCAKLKGRQQ